MAAEKPIDPFQLDILLSNLDATATSINRPPIFGTVPPSHTDLTLCKDITLDPANNTYLRLYLPRNTRQLEEQEKKKQKLPILIDYHGGGFVFFSPSTQFIHDLNVRLSAHLQALIISLEYRLAPEHRLPTAYEDAMDAIKWVRDHALGLGGVAHHETEPWIKDHGDFSNCFLMGLSAGGNIAYRAGLCALDIDLRPLEIKGLILNQPYFSSEQLTPSEARLENDSILPLHANHLMWSFALPLGADRDHEYCNPTAKGGRDNKNIARLPRCLVIGYEGDPLVDMEKEFVKLLKARGVEVVPKFFEGGFHAVEYLDPPTCKVYFQAVEEFVHHAPAAPSPDCL